MEKSGRKYVKGTPVICTKNKGGFFNNQLFDIVGWTKKTLKIKDTESGTVKKITLEEFETDMWEYGHAFTTHSAQGSTLQGNVCIWESERMSRELLYTAVSRCTALSNLWGLKELRGIKKEGFTKQWEPTQYDKVKRGNTGYLYELYDKKTDETFYVGSTDDIETRMVQHEMAVMKGDEARVYEYIRENPIDFNIRQIRQVLYDHKSELEREEYQTIQQYIKAGGVLQNEMGITVEEPVGIRQGKYTEKKKEKIGSVVRLKDEARFVWRVNGKRKVKKWRVTKKRTLEQAIKLAEQFQKEVSL